MVFMLSGLVGSTPRFAKMQHFSLNKITYNLFKIEKDNQIIDWIEINLGSYQYGSSIERFNYRSYDYHVSYLGFSSALNRSEFETIKNTIQNIKVD